MALHCFIIAICWYEFRRETCVILGREVPSSFFSGVCTMYRSPRLAVRILVHVVPFRTDRSRTGLTVITPP